MPSSPSIMDTSTYLSFTPDASPSSSSRALLGVRRMDNSLDLSLSQHSPSPTSENPDSDDIFIEISPWREPLKAGKLEARLEGRQLQESSSIDQWRHQQPPKLKYLNHPAERINYNLNKQVRIALDRTNAHRLLLQQHGLISEQDRSSSSSSQAFETKSTYEEADQQYHSPYSPNVSTEAFQEQEYDQQSPKESHIHSDMSRNSSQLLSRNPWSKELLDPSFQQQSSSDEGRTCPETSQLQTQTHCVENPAQFIPHIPLAQETRSVENEGIGKPIWKLYPKAEEKRTTHQTHQDISNSLASLWQLPLLPRLSRFSADFLLPDSSTDFGSSAFRASQENREDGMTRWRNTSSEPRKDCATSSATTTIVPSKAYHGVEDVSKRWRLIADRKNRELAAKLAVSEKDISAWYKWLTKYSQGFATLDSMDSAPPTSCKSIPAPISPSELARLDFLGELDSLVARANILSREHGLNFHLRRLSKALNSPAMLSISLFSETQEHIITSCGHDQVVKDLKSLPRQSSLGFHIILQGQAKLYNIKDLQAHKVFKENPFVQQHSLLSYVAHPLVICGHIVGVLAISDTSTSSTLSSDHQTAIVATAHKIQRILASLRAAIHTCSDSFDMASTADRGTRESSLTSNHEESSDDVLNGALSRSLGRKHVSSTFLGKVFRLKRTAPDEEMKPLDAATNGRDDVFLDTISRPLLKTSHQL